MMDSVTGGEIPLHGSSDSCSQATLFNAERGSESRRDSSQPEPPSYRSFDTRPHAVVIGAGLGGLSTGIHLANAGWRVQIFESNRRSGGRMNVIEEQGFRIDMGPTMLMMPEVIEQLFRTCGRDIKDYLCMQQIAPSYTVVWPDGTRLAMSRRVEDLCEAVRKIAPQDADRIPALYEAMRKKYLNARYNFIEKPFNSFVDMLKPHALQGIARALPIESVYRFVSRYVRDERIRQAFTFQTLYLGISPHECPSIYALLPYIETEFGVWFPKGGTIALANAMEGLFRELGGEIHFCEPVERIVTEGRRAVGVRTAGGDEVRADVVVCNADLPMAYKRLLPDARRRMHTDESLDKMRYGCSGFLLYLGVRKIESDWGHNTILLSDDYDSILNDICRDGSLPRDPAMHICIPTRTDPDLAPVDHDVVYVLVPCPNTHNGNIDWSVEGPRLREIVLDKLEASGLPGLRSKIVFERDFTPPQFEAMYGCYAGAAYSSLSPTFFQSAVFRPHSRAGDFDDLFFVGAGTHPGGGVPIVLTSGRLVAADILSRGARRAR